MSLRIWCPLRSDFRNHGCETGAIIDETSNTKIGGDGMFMLDKGACEFVYTKNCIDNRKSRKTYDICRNMTSGLFAKYGQEPNCYSVQIKTLPMMGIVDATSVKDFTASINISGPGHFFFGFGPHNSVTNTFNYNTPSTLFNNCVGFCRINKTSLFEVFCGSSSTNTKVNVNVDQSSNVYQYLPDCVHNYMIVHNSAQHILSFLIDGKPVIEYDNDAAYNTVISNIKTAITSEAVLGVSLLPSGISNLESIGDDSACVCMNDLRLYDTCLTRRMIDEVVNNMDMYLKLDKLHFSDSSLLGVYDYNDILNWLVNSTPGSLTRYCDCYSFSKGSSEISSISVQTATNSAFTSNIKTYTVSIDEQSGVLKEGVRRIFFNNVNVAQTYFRAFVTLSNGSIVYLVHTNKPFYIGYGLYVFEINFVDNTTGVSTVLVKDIALKKAYSYDDHGCYKPAAILADTSVSTDYLKSKIVTKSSRLSVPQRAFCVCENYNTDTQDIVPGIYAPKSISTEVFSVGMWIYNDSNRSNSLDIINCNKGDSFVRLHFTQKSTTCGVETHVEEKSIITNPTVKLDDWNHFMVTRDYDGFVKVYLNGVSVATTDLRGDMCIDEKTCFAEFIGNSFELCDFRMYNRCVSEDYVKILFGRKVHMDSQNTIIIKEYMEYGQDDENYIIVHTDDPFDYNIRFYDCEDMNDTQSDPTTLYFEYSYDTITWTEWNGASNLTFNNKRPLYLRGINQHSTTTLGFYYSKWDETEESDVYHYIRTSISPVSTQTNARGVYLTGNLINWLDYRIGTTEETDTAYTMTTSAFYRLFYNCTYLLSAPSLPYMIQKKNGGYLELPATSYMCQEMYRECTRLKHVPDIEYVYLSSNTCHSMFRGCTSLEVAPKLKSKTLDVACYQYMFYGCTSLKVAPELPATYISSCTSCYLAMFRGCTSLKSAPKLPAIALPQNAYYSMFYNCTSLVDAPELPATTLGASCYYSMFYGCTSLKMPPVLPATTLGASCYYSMFQGCTSLVQAPELPATTLTARCYQQMFYGCTSLKYAMKTLPAGTLTTHCYYQMFYNCQALVKGPFIKANSAAVTYCCNQMFQSCTKLKLIEVSLQGTAPTTNQVGNMLTSAGTNNGTNKFIIFRNGGVQTTLTTTNCGRDTNWKLTTIS